MSRFLAGLVVAFALTASADTGETDRLDQISLDPGQRQLLAFSGATAAYSLDPRVADVVLLDGVPTIVAIAPGTASLVIVTSSGMQYVSILVLPPEEQLAGNSGARSARTSAFEMQYDSFSRRLQNIVTAATRTEDRVTSMRLNYTRLHDAPPGGARHVIPAVSYRIADRRGELVLFDDFVRSSPLTVDGQSVRGLHLRRGGFQAHAGYSSYAFFNNVLLSRQRNAMAGVDYRIALNEHSGWTPRLYIFPTRNSTRGTDGVTASVGYDYRRGAALNLVAAAGLSRSLSDSRVTAGGSLNLSHASARDRASLRVLYQPDGFASLNTAVHGLRSDGVWMRNVSSRLKSTLSFDANRYRFASFQQSNANLNFGLRQELVPKWFLSSGARSSYFDSRTSQQPAVRSYEIPIGIEYATPRFGSLLEYRYTRSNVSDQAGTGVRASVRASSARTSFDLHLDRATQVPSLHLIFAENPGLDLALRELGLTATTPVQLARLLREHPELVDFGAISGVDVNISAVRYELGSGFAWMTRGPRDTRVGITATYSRNEAPSLVREAALASISYGLLVARSLNLSVQYSRFFTHSTGRAWAAVDGWQVSFRQQFDGMPSFSRLFARRGAIEGIVFADADDNGAHGPGEAGIAGAEVLLDDGIRTTSNAEGKFRFDRVSADDAHRVEVRYASAKPFHFTTASAVSASVGKTVTVGIGPVAGHLTVRVSSTERLPIANVRVSVSDGRRVIGAVTGEGKAAIDLARAGIYQVSVNAESVPSGYLLLDPDPRSVAIEEGRPAEIEFLVKAMRSVSGTVRGRAAARAPIEGARVLLDGMSTSTTDAQGTYLFSDVSPGVHVLTAEVGESRSRREFKVPSTPGALRGIDLELNVAAVAAPAEAAHRRLSGLGLDGYVIQIRLLAAGLRGGS